MSESIKVSTMAFCPKCKTLLSFQYKDTEFVRHCSSCNFVERITENVKVKSTIYKTENVTGEIQEGVIHDRALLRTSKIKCPNSSCPTADKSLWGTKVKGILVHPDMCIMNYTDLENRVNTYVCRVCSHSFKPT